jgi:hypothetical protein
MRGSRPWARLSRLVSIAKSVFQAHGVDVDGTVVIRKRISRSKSRGTLGSLAMFAAERLVAR